ncbi:TetR/AcrR family transcriptional regulator [Salinactinospora qingdaonensis]|uniref:HTH tetR-type domain-containing protein n=1 Tax=Salinactinospora qingdaonensis TaxID=702744 RepID=A0ABP7FVF9_9ACTN
MAAGHTDPLPPRQSQHAGGRPPMSERRKAAFRLEIARSAVHLFTTRGVAATTGEDIAEVLGISARTLWRYFPSKESCVRPLLTSKLDAFVELLRECPREVALTDFLAQARLPDTDGFPAEESVWELIRMTHSEPGLRAVWLQVHHEAETVLARFLAERAGGSSEDLEVRVQAGILNVALRVAAEERAWHGPGGDTTTDVWRRALLTAAAGLPAFGESG